MKYSHHKSIDIFLDMQENTEKKISPSKSRVAQFIDYLGISKNKFYLITGLSNGILDKESGLTLANAEKIISSFPELNATWMITGKGEMLVKPSAQTHIDSKGDHNRIHIGQSQDVYNESSELNNGNSSLTNKHILLLEDHIKLLNDKIQLLEEQIRTLKENK